jgi:hypothetical protein
VGINFPRLSEKKEPACLVTMDEATGDIIDIQVSKKQEREAPGWGGGICIAFAICEMRGGTVKANTANKGGGIFVSSPEEIKEMNGVYYGSRPPPGVSGVFRQTGGDIAGNTAGEIKNADG